MNTCADEPPLILGCIIAGGNSNRFGEDNKALAALGNLSLIERVHTRLAPQVQATWLNVPDQLTLPEPLNHCRRITDIALPSETEKRGPLAGILPCLQAAAEAGYEWLLIAPCDTPFLPDNLSSVLHKECLAKNAQLGICQSGERQHPSVSLWHTDLCDDLYQAVVQQSKGGFKQFYPGTRHCFAHWSTEGYDPFFNINYSTDLEMSLSILKQHPNLK